MRPIYIFDLDGTLANAEHRVHLIQGPKKDWKAFFAAAKDDTPIDSVIRTMQTLHQSGAEIWVWTGRSDEVREDTAAWLLKYCQFNANSFFSNLCSPERFMMRKAGDYRPDHVIKAEWLSMLDPPVYNRLTAVFEDRDRVVEMWRAAGVTCFQVAKGEF